ncbi:MAG: hypothetical protein JXA62_07985 [Candidatus Aminicenantes bacterium]|nr:hypothetical protein [Candidatus Aminicenantes bacterium]
MALRNRLFSVLLLTLLLCMPIVSGHRPAGTGPAAAVVPNLRLIRPNGGEILFKGENTAITWASRGIESGRIILVLYLKGVKHVVISEGRPDTGRYDWRVPVDLSPENNYRIRIRWSLHPEINDFSDADFRIADKSN